MKENLLMFVFKSDKNLLKDHFVNFLDSIRKKKEMPVQPAISPLESSLEAEQKFKLTEIGRILRKSRQEQGISLEDIYNLTMLRESVLTAIEDGELQQLPEPIYLQGMIKRYGDTLGLDGASLAQEFPTDAPEKTLIPAVEVQDSGFELRPFHLYIVYLLVIIGSVNGLTYWLNRSQQTLVSVEAVQTASPLVPGSTAAPPTTKPQPTTTTTTQSPTKTPESVASPANPPESAKATTPQLVSETQPVASPSPSPTPNPTTPANQSVQVGLTFKDASWVLIEVDGKTEFEGILPQGTQKSWQAKEELVIVAGNAGGVLVTVNNGKAEQFGEPGTVKEVVFKADAKDASIPSSSSEETTQDPG